VSEFGSGIGGDGGVKSRNHISGVRNHEGLGDSSEEKEECEEFGSGWREKKEEKRA